MGDAATREGAEKALLAGLAKGSTVRLGAEWFSPNGWFSGDFGRAEALAAKHRLVLQHFERDAVFVFSLGGSHG